MTGAVTTKYENEYTVKHKTTSFSYKSYGNEKGFSEKKFFVGGFKYESWF